MTRSVRVFIDANVFVATWTLDVLLTLADRGAIEPVWSDLVLNEARNAVNRVHVTDGGARYIPMTFSWSLPPSIPAGYCLR